MAFGFKSIGGALGRAYDYVTPGVGSSRLTDWGGWGDRASGGNTNTGWQAPKPAPTVNVGSSGGSNNDFVKTLQAQIRALQNQTAAIPRLPAFDIMANYNRARSQAEQAVNPLYSKKLNDFLSRQTQLKANKQREAGLQRETVENELTQGLQENEVNRVRTDEDLTSAVQRIGETETRFQRDEGTQFADEREALAEQVAASGLTGAGLGNQRLQQQMKQRNVATEDQVKEFQNQRSAKRLMRDRTFEDLVRDDSWKRKGAEGKKKAIDFDVETYMEELAYDEQKTRLDLEISRLEDIGNQTESFRGQGVQQFLAGLVGSGARSQDIALAQQVYGR